MRFSQRIGKTTVRQILQIESIDEQLANELWNIFYHDFFMNLTAYRSKNEIPEKIEALFKIWRKLFGNRVDEIPKTYKTVDEEKTLSYIKEWFFNAKWYHKYDLIEFICDVNDFDQDERITELFNKTLKKNMAGYTIIKGKLIQITSEVEIKAIEEALNVPQKFKLVHTHLKTSLDLLSNRENPDYRNSFKESISAIESICKILTGNEKAKLSVLLKKLEDDNKSHPAISGAFSKLYGFSSDYGGVRHSLINGKDEITLELAKFMLVSCSAFVNYLKSTA